MGSPHANKEPKTYPSGTTFSEWYLTKDADQPSIRRYCTPPGKKKTQERYPIGKYRRILTDPSELDRLIIRLNGDDPDKRRAKALFAVRDAYVSQAVLTKYYDDVLRLAIKSEKDARTAHKYLIEYGLYFFMIKLGVSSPIDWELQQGLWGRSLLNREDDPLPAEHRLLPVGKILSAKVIRYIIWELNRFLAYLHKQRKHEIPLIILEPIPKRTLDDHESRRSISGQIDASKYVDDAHWAIIKAALVQRKVPYAPLVYLCRHYGLRRNEGLGLSTDRLKTGHLLVDRQLIGYLRDKNDKVLERKFDVVKGKLSRKVPHQMANMGQNLDTVYNWITEVEALEMHFDTISRQFGDMTEQLCGERYNLDDLRPTFITDAMTAAVTADPKQGPEEVRLASGHVNLKTTYDHYVKDIRKLESQVYRPKHKDPNVTSEHTTANTATNVLRLA